MAERESGAEADRTSETPSAGETRAADAGIERAAALLGADPRFVSYLVEQPHPGLLLVRQPPLSGSPRLDPDDEPASGDATEGVRDERQPEPVVALLGARAWDTEREALRPYASLLAEGAMVLVLIGAPRGPEPGATARYLSATLPAEPEPFALEVALQGAFQLLGARARAHRRGRVLGRYRYELGELIAISRALTTERNIDKLLGLILEKARYITGADAGSIYVVEGDDPDPALRTLRFKLSQNASIEFDSAEFTVPISARSIAGMAALTRSNISLADVYDLPEGSEFAFDRRFDERIGYRTRSMVTAPLVNHEGAVIGVLQLINKKRNPGAKLVVANLEAEVVPFDEPSLQLLSTLAANAGIALENAMLYAEIQELFAGFVKASVAAIEQRDPTTSGHSRRVADLTVALARAVERGGEGPYRGVTWSPKDLREIEFASLLHDFGKIGVREQVLVKAKKLYPAQIEAIQRRIDLAVQGAEIAALRGRMQAMGRAAPGAELLALDEAFERRRAQLEGARTAIEAACEPTILKEGDFARIEALAHETYVDLRGVVQPLLTPTEVASLCVPRGSLNEAEVDEIRSHVVHTHRFLRTIPWGSSFGKVPLIAGAHHERLDGTGYPHGLVAEQIPLQSKMMSISDIFDALTASDRPYKRAVPVDRALDILNFEVRDRHVDGDLVRVFVASRCWDGVLGPGGSG